MAKNCILSAVGLILLLSLSACGGTVAAADRIDSPQAAHHEGEAPADHATGDYREAAEAAERAVELSRKQRGRNDPETLRLQLRLSEALLALGEYRTALKAGNDVLLVRQAQSANSVETAEALHLVSEIHASLGDFAPARTMGERALQIRRAKLGDRSPRAAESMNDLGVQAANRGDFPAAIPMIDEAWQIRRESLGDQDEATAESLHNLAFLRAKYEAPRLPSSPARELRSNSLRDLQSVLAIRRGRLGVNHPATARCLNSIAQLQMDLGHISEARVTMRSAAEILEMQVPNHPDTAAIVQNLAVLDLQEGDFVRAEAGLKRSLGIWERALPKEHQRIAVSYMVRAGMQRRLGRYRPALDLYRQGLEIEDRLLSKLFAATLEDERLRYLRQTMGHHHAALSLIRSRFARDPDAIRFGFELVARHKGRVIEAAPEKQRQQAFAASLPSSVEASWRNFLSLRTERAKLLTSTVSASADFDARRMADLERQILLSQQSLAAQFRWQERQDAFWEFRAADLANRLPPDSVLIEFAEVWDLYGGGGTAAHGKSTMSCPGKPTLSIDAVDALVTRGECEGSSKAAQRYYVAFLLSPDGQLKLFDLGDAAAIDDKILATLKMIQSSDEVGSELLTALSELYSMLLEPIARAGTLPNRLIISPDGALHRVPFAALRPSDNSFLVERNLVVLVGSGRDLLWRGNQWKGDLDLLAVGDPSFDSRAGLGKGAFAALRARNYPTQPWTRLNESGPEAVKVESEVAGKTRLLLANDATESALRATHAPRILHVATHGDFLPFDQRDGTVSVEEPMLASFLLFAGANHAHGIERGDDGVLTALEVSGMDLTGTDLVVLSACNTAAAAVSVDGGLYGLRRAFALAGARNVVMNLWSADDTRSRELTEAFYASYLSDRDVEAALRNAQMSLMRRLREEGEPDAVAVSLWALLVAQRSVAYR